MRPEEIIESCMFSRSQEPEEVLGAPIRVGYKAFRSAIRGMSRRMDCGHPVSVLRERFHSEWNRGRYVEVRESTCLWCQSLDQQRLEIVADMEDQAKFWDGVTIDKDYAAPAAQELRNAAKRLSRGMKISIRNLVHPAEGGKFFVGLHKKD